MICLTIPAFALRAPLLRRPELAGRPVALAPAPGSKPSSGRAPAPPGAGVRPGMRLSEALATCPSLELVEQDPAGVEEEWEAVLRRLEGAGFAVEPVEPGCALLQTRGMSGLPAASGRHSSARSTPWGRSGGRVWAQPPVASRRSPRPPWRRPVALVIDDGETHLFLEPLPSTSFRSPERREELSELGVKRLGSWHASPGLRSPTGSVRTARKHGGSLGGGRHLRRAAPSAGRAG